MAEQTDPAVIAHMKAQGKGFDPTLCKWHGDELSKMQKELHGNGKDGLIDNMTKLMVKLARVETKLTIAILLLVPMTVSAIAAAFHLLTTK